MFNSRKKWWQILIRVPCTLEEHSTLYTTHVGLLMIQIRNQNFILHIEWFTSSVTFMSLQPFIFCYPIMAFSTYFVNVWGQFFPICERNDPSQEAPGQSMNKILFLWCDSLKSSLGLL